MPTFPASLVLFTVLVQLEKYATLLVAQNVPRSLERKLLHCQIAYGPSIFCEDFHHLEVVIHLFVLHYLAAGLI